MQSAHDLYKSEQDSITRTMSLGVDQIQIPYSLQNFDWKQKLKPDFGCRA